MKTVTIHLGESGDVKSLLKQIDPHFSNVMCLIIGDPGSGKSSLACAFGLEEMSSRVIPKYKDACNKIAYLNGIYGPVLNNPPQKHLVYCAGFKIKKKENVESYDFDPYRIGVRDDNFETQYFEKHSFRIIDEVQTYFNSNKKDLPPRVEANFQKCRHYDIFNVGTAQFGIEVHVRLRRLSSFIQIVETKTILNNSGLVEETQWICNYLGKNKNYEMFEESNYSQDYVICKVIFKLKRNVFKYYNSTSCEEEFDDITNSFSSHFNQGMPFSATNPPKGYYKKSEATTKKQKEEE